MFDVQKRKQVSTHICCMTSLRNTPSYKSLYSSALASGGLKVSICQVKDKGNKNMSIQWNSTSYSLFQICTCLWWMFNTGLLLVSLNMMDREPHPGRSGWCSATWFFKCMYDKVPVSIQTTLLWSLEQDTELVAIISDQRNTAITLEVELLNLKAPSHPLQQYCPACNKVQSLDPCCFWSINDLPDAVQHYKKYNSRLLRRQPPLQYRGVKCKKNKKNTHTQRSGLSGSMGKYLADEFWPK